jgi:hypothetical protein
VFSFDGPSDLLRMMFPAWQATLLSLTIYFQLARCCWFVGWQKNYIFSSKILKAEANKFDSDSFRGDVERKNQFVLFIFGPWDLPRMDFQSVFSLKHTYLWLVVQVFRF